MYNIEKYTRGEVLIKIKEILKVSPFEVCTLMILKSPSFRDSTNSYKIILVQHLSRLLLKAQG
jgi:hypothetical protein